MAGNETNQVDSEEENVWEYKKPDKNRDVQFKAGSIPRPKRLIRRKKNQDGDGATATSSTKEEQHAGTTASEEAAAAIRAYEKQRAGGEALTYDNPPTEDEESDHASSRGGEQSPTVDDFEANLDGFPVMAAGPSLNDELGSDYDGYSHNGIAAEAASDDDDLSVDPARAIPSPSSNATSDRSSDSGNDLVEPASTESAQGMEAGVLEMRRERDGLKKELESRDVRAAELEKELESRRKRAEALEADVASRDERIAALAKDLESHGERLATLGKELETREEQLTALGKDLESRDQGVAALDKDLEARNQSVTALEMELESRDKRLAALEKERESHSKESAAMKKGLASRDEEIAALKKQSEARNNEIAAREKELESRDKELESRAERIAALRTKLASRNGELAALEKDLALRNKRISGLGVQNSQLTTGTTKTASTRDSATNTEASPGDAVSRPDSSRAVENDQRLVTAKRGQPASPASSFVMKMADLLRFIQMCSAMLKTFYLTCISLAGTASARAKSFLLSVGRSESFQGAIDAAQQSVRASAIYLATPFWIIMSFAMFMSIWRERSYWVQANAVTRKHLLKHATGVSEIADWEVFFAIGSAAMS